MKRIRRCLLNSLSEEDFETFTLTLINERQSLNYNKVFAALVNYEVRRQNRFSSSGSTTRVSIGRTEVIKEDQNPDQVSEI